MSDKELALFVREKIQNEKPQFPKEQYISAHTVLNSLYEQFDAVGVATRCAANPNSKYFGQKVEDIIASWRAKGESAASSGSSLDLHIQALLNGTEQPDLTQADKDFIGKVEAFKLFKSEIIDAHGLELVGTELKLYHRCGLYGRNDASFVANGKLFVFDWKQNESISYFAKEKMIGPAAFLDNSKINLITTQLYLYKYIIEEQFGFSVASVRAIQFKKDGKYEIHKPHYEYSKELIEQFIEWARNTSKLN